MTRLRLLDLWECPEKQTKGTPIYIRGYTFHLRRWGTPEASAKQKEISLKLFGPLHKYEPEDDKLLFAHWLCEYGVVGWEDVPDEDGKPVKFSPRRARELFLDPQYWLSLNQMLFAEATNYENYLADKVEEAVDDIKKP